MHIDHPKVQYRYRRKSATEEASSCTCIPPYDGQCAWPKHVVEIKTKIWGLCVAFGGNVFAIDLGVIKESHLRPQSAGF
jgi:hypothetical protein